MKKLTLLSIVAMSLLIFGCGQQKAADAKTGATKSETVATKAAKAVEATKETAKAAGAKGADVAKKAKEVVTEKTAKVVEVTKETAKAAVAKGADVAKKAKDAVVAVTTKAPPAFGKCAGCHGKDGKMKALGKSAVIAGQSKADLIKKMKEYQSGKRNVAGMGGLMKGQVVGLNDADIDAIATYIAGLK